MHPELHYEHYDIFSTYAGIFTKDFEVGDKIMWLGHDGVYGYLYGETYVATQEHIDKKEDMPMWKIIGSIRLSKLDHNMRPIKNDDNEVTHKVFFGENIKRLIRAFKKEKNNENTEKIG